MQIESNNQSSMNMSQFGDSIAFEVKDVSPIHAKITQSRKITPSTGDTLFVYGWVAISAQTNGLTLSSDDVYGKGVVVDPGDMTDPSVQGNPSTFVLYNPIVTQGLTVDQEVFIIPRGFYSFTYAEPRGNVDASTLIYDVLGGGSGSGGVTSVQCVANMLVVGY